MELFHSHHFFLIIGKRYKGVLKQDESISGLKVLCLFTSFMITTVQSPGEKNTHMEQNHPNMCPPSAMSFSCLQLQRGRGETIRQTPQTTSSSSPHKTLKAPCPAIWPQPISLYPQTGILSFLGVLLTLLAKTGLRRH